MNPKVTVIVVTYNQRSTIGRALESVISQQTDFDFEILIGDDGSTDGTRQICEQWAQMHPGKVRLMPEAPNKGVTDNYFDCMEAARGEYIADCAGDDWWADSGKLKKQVEILDGNPQLALVHTAWRPVDATTQLPGKEVVGEWAAVSPAGTMLLPLLQHKQPVPVHLSTALYRRSMLMELYRRDPGLFRNGCAEDLPVTAMLSAHYPVSYIPEVTLNYSVGSDTVSNPARLARAAGFYRNSLALTARLAEKTGVSIRQLTPDLRRLHAYALSLAIQSGEKEAVDRLAETCRAIGLSPSPKSRLKELIHRIKRF